MVSQVVRILFESIAVHHRFCSLFTFVRLSKMHGEESQVLCYSDLQSAVHTVVFKKLNVPSQKRPRSFLLQSFCD